MLHRSKFMWMSLVGLLFVGTVTGCEDNWETKIPSAELSADPYEDLYRLLVTTKPVPTLVEVSETVATLQWVTTSGVITRPIPFVEVDVRLKHNTSTDKWAVDLYKPDGKRLIRLDSPDANHANQLAMAFAAVKTLIAQSRS